MAVTYENREGKTYYLHAKKTKTGKEYHYFSRKEKPNEGAWLAHEIPSGYEVYERPQNAVVFLRREIVPQLTEDEVKTVRKGMQDCCRLETHEYKLDVQEDNVTILELDQDVDKIVALLSPARTYEGMAVELAAQIGTYTAMMRFSLADRQARTFNVQRYCFLSGIDEWITIACGGQLPDLVREYVQHIGQDSFFELM